SHFFTSLILHFFYHHPTTTYIYTLSLHDALPIFAGGTLSPWNPNANTTVYALAVSGSTIYAGGDFTSIGGQSRNKIAALDATTGSATSWNPNATGGAFGSSVFALAVNGSTVYAGGFFNNIGGQARKGIAALDV